MNEEMLQKALTFFEPRPPDSDIPQILERLQEIIAAYQHDASRTRLIQAPFPMFQESDEAYMARVQALVDVPRKRGRPARLAQEILVFNLRDLLMKNGCHYGAPKPEERRSRLAELAEFIHEAAGVPQKRVGWRSIAERMADPTFQLDLVVGNYPDRPTKVSADAKRALGAAIPKPPKNKS